MKTPFLFLFVTILFMSFSFVSCRKDPSLREPLIIKDMLVQEEFPYATNLHKELSYKPYNEVVFATTHNSFNYGDGSGTYKFPNQQYNITRQLNDGIRALMIDVYLKNNEVVVYHGYEFTGIEPFANNLSEIKIFLDENPNEVVTIILECYVDAPMIKASFEKAGLIPFLYTKIDGTPWLRLGDMVRSNKRLVVFSDENDANGMDWYHYIWKHGVETHFTNNQISDFNCNFNRGAADNDLFIINHFLTTPTLGTGSLPLSAQANASPYLLERASECKNATGKIPNFLAVDFYAEGSVFEAVDKLNGVH